MSRDGEYIPLWWDADEAPPEFVRGHVTDEVALAAINAENEEPLEPKRAEISHTWARWSFADTHSRADGHEHSLVECVGPGVGRFKVTKVDRKSH